MPQEYDIVIADTSCFILLDKINELGILKNIFNNISTTPQVAAEFIKPLPEWVTIVAVIDTHYLQILETEVDSGEASAIALAIEKGNALLLLDDDKARKLASRLNLLFTGTLGVIKKAKEKNIIESVTGIINKIQQTNFRFSQKIANEILREVGEL